ncbi:MAG: hypothetical protein M3Y85_05155, partial [Bacteroidota bacterium]|nr:hypothetical protein [Bacteroidota bacterium]
NKVVQSMKDIKWDEQPALSSQYKEIEIEIRKPSQEELAAAKKLLSATDYRKIQIVDTGNLKKIYAREQVLLNEFGNVIYFPVQAIKIGKIIIGGLGGEIFAATGLSLKQSRGDAHYFTISLANGNAGYIPPEKEFALGGYETWRCRTSHLEINAENKIRDTLKKFINSLSDL